MSVDAKTNRLYVADGYGNRRILIVDAATGQYVGHFGAYGQNPVVDDPSSGVADTDVGPWIADYQAGNLKPLFFRSPMHCATVSRDGFLYACDRGNNRVQIFELGAADLGKPCANPNAEAGKCGFVGEIHVAPQTASGTSGTATLSTDPGQTCLYVGDLAQRHALHHQPREPHGARPHRPSRPPSRRVPLAARARRRFARRHLHRRSRYGAARAEIPALRIFELQRHRQRRSRPLQQQPLSEIPMTYTKHRVSRCCRCSRSPRTLRPRAAQNDYGNPNMTPVNDLPNPYAARQVMPLPDGRSVGLDGRRRRGERPRRHLGHRPLRQQYLRRLARRIRSCTTTRTAS